MKQLTILCLALLVIACKKEEKQTQVKQETKTEIKIDNTSKTKPKSKDWEVLFDGTSMDQWRGYGSDKIYSEWSIEDGTLAFTPGKEGGKNIITKKTYKNFMLSLEWKISKNGNSGIFWGVHEDKQYKEAYETGPEIQVLDNNGHPDAKVTGGTHKAGSLYDMIACPDKYINPHGEWNWCVIEVNHDKNLGKVRMNGKHVFTFPVNGPGWDRIVANSKFKDWEGFGKYPRGHIGLQDHSDKVWFRDIKIKEL